MSKSLKKWNWTFSKIQIPRNIVWDHALQSLEQSVMLLKQHQKARQRGSLCCAARTQKTMLRNNFATTDMRGVSSGRQTLRRHAIHYCQYLSKAAGWTFSIFWKLAAYPGRKLAAYPGRKLAAYSGRKLAAQPGRKLAAQPGRKLASYPRYLQRTTIDANERN